MQHFGLNDDFLAIIRRPAEKIPTGWTNYVFCAKKFGRNYIYRFPRDAYWVDTLKKERWFNRFIRGRVPVRVVKLKLKRESGGHQAPRFFSIHKYISGEALTTAYPRMTPEQKRILARDIVGYIRALNAVDIKKLDLPMFSSFCEGIARQTNDPAFKYKEIFASLYECEKNADNFVLTHGDFNPGNIIVDENMKMTAVLDYAFACKFIPGYADLSVVMARLDNEFRETLITEYESKCGPINRALLNDLIKVRLEIEADYIKYMARTHPDIRF